MTLRKIFVIGAAVAALGLAAGAALAQTPQQKALVDAAKAAGTVGEQADGYVGVRTSVEADVRAAIESMNAARRAAYARSAAEAGVSVDVAAARMFDSQLRARLTTGEWYRNAQGQWVQR